MSNNLKTPTARTPCRRMGLSKNFNKGISPALLSPLVVDVTPKSTFSRTLKSVTSAVARTEERKLPKENICANENEVYTPIVSAPRQSLSTGGFRYRLSLNKGIRDKLSKKKIDFVAHSVDASEKFEVVQSADCMDSNKSTPSALSEQIFAIKADIATKKRKIAAIETHNKEIEDLEAAIGVWKNGFQQAIHSFRSQLTPAQDVQSILQHLNIPLSTLDI